MKAIVLISGGLDSTLAAKFMQNLGIELVCLNTVTPFCLCNRRSSSGCLHGAVKVAGELKLRLVSIDVTEEFLEIVKKPKHGYGSNMNPCIDCRILLFKKARVLMQEEGASFIITGEVLGQRPMSQRLNTMRLIEKEADVVGLVLRPLSAKVLDATIPEREGWILRDKLLAISGRGRRGQMGLAQELGINDYPCPSGGCLLTDPEFSRRLKDLMAHQEFNAHDIQLLKTGRHFRLTPDSKLIVGRNELENERLLSLAQDNDYLFMPSDELPGPTCLGRGNFNARLIKLSSQIACRYCDLDGRKNADIIYKKVVKKGAVPCADNLSFFNVSPIEEDKLVGVRI